MWKKCKTWRGKEAI
jgi:hypothetical protein